MTGAPALTDSDRVLPPSAALAHERGGLALLEPSRPIHVAWPRRADFIEFCLRARPDDAGQNIDGIEQMIRDCATRLWFDSKLRQGIELDDEEEHTRAEASPALEDSGLQPFLRAMTAWAAHTAVLDDPATRKVWLMNVLTGASSAIAYRSRPVPIPPGSGLLNIAIAEDSTPSHDSTACVLPPKDLGVSHFTPPDDWKELCEELGFGWREGNTATTLYAWSGGWTLTYGNADRDARAWYLCGTGDYDLFIDEAGQVPDIPLPATGSPADGHRPRNTLTMAEVVAGAMDIDLQKLVHDLQVSRAQRQSTSNEKDPHRAGTQMDITDDLWWLCNAYNCGGAVYVWHGRNDFFSELSEMSLSLWTANLFDLHYDCAYDNPLTQARYLVGRLDALGADRSHAYLALSGAWMNTTTSILSGTDQSSGQLGMLAWYLWALLAPRYHAGHLLTGATHQVDPAVIDEWCRHHPHGAHLPSREAWHRACRAKIDVCTTCRTRPLSDLIQGGPARCPASLTARRVRVPDNALASIDAQEVDWPTIEAFDRWVGLAIDLAYCGDATAIPDLDRAGDDILLRLLRLAASREGHGKRRATIALCVLLSMAAERNISRLLGTLNLTSVTQLLTRPYVPGEAP
ncbi:hypothetical protein AB0I81_36055 [Nonomuraea sp. NPDC050404]|uniref:hypothetical protein n=1 Tax=Nonomuraea sp. NPDC050404 TaxID=3155783 RepID=UPI0034083244